MAWNYHCEICGAALDPGEKCDCQQENEQQEHRAALHPASAPPIFKDAAPPVPLRPSVK